MSEASPVTTVVTRRVKAGRTVDYEDWLSGLLDEASSLEGYLGADIHRPTTGSSDSTYTSVFRFETLDQLQAFERSDMRRRHLDAVGDLVDSDAAWKTHTGLELWFAAPPGTVVPQPVRWRMAVVLGTVVYVLVLVFGTIAAATMGDVPAPVRLAIVIAVEIALMTYVILPRVTRLLSRWIYPTTATA